MKSSVFVGFHNTNAENPGVLVIQRRDKNGSWYLPGGGFPEGCKTIREAVDVVLARQLEIKRSSYALGYWTLSVQAGGGAVHLQLGQLTPSMQTMTLMDWSTNQYIQRVAIFGINHVHRHLYHTGLMPWGQAKMALVALYTREYLSRRQNMRPDGELLWRDLGMLGGYEWKRP